MSEMKEIEWKEVKEEEKEEMKDIEIKLKY